MSMQRNITVHGVVERHDSDPGVVQTMVKLVAVGRMDDHWERLRYHSRFKAVPKRREIPREQR
jgi:hypothetical protein